MTILVRNIKGAVAAITVGGTDVVPFTTEREGGGAEKSVSLSAITEVKNFTGSPVTLHGVSFPPGNWSGEQVITAVTSGDAIGATGLEVTYTGAVGAVLSADPVASFTEARDGTTILKVNFTNTSTGTSLTHEWDFGDATTSTSASPSKTYGAAGIYLVVLTVTDDYGRTDIKRKYVAVAQATASGAGAISAVTSITAPEEA